MAEPAAGLGERVEVVVDRAELAILCRVLMLPVRQGAGRIVARAIAQTDHSSEDAERGEEKNKPLGIHGAAQRFR